MNFVYMFDRQSYIYYFFIENWKKGAMTAHII